MMRVRVGQVEILSSTSQSRYLDVVNSSMSLPLCHRVLTIYGNEIEF